MVPCPPLDTLLPDSLPAGDPDADTDVKLSDIATVSAINSGRYHACAQQNLDLQGWVRAQQALAAKRGQ